jgi:hypothetical protein
MLRAAPKVRLLYTSSERGCKQTYFRRSHSARSKRRRTPRHPAFRCQRCLAVLSRMDKCSGDSQPASHQRPSAKGFARLAHRRQSICQSGTFAIAVPDWRETASVHPTGKSPRRSNRTPEDGWTICSSTHAAAPCRWRWPLRPASSMSDASWATRWLKRTGSGTSATYGVDERADHRAR